MTPECPIPSLPVGVQLTYFAEGGANIVYRQQACGPPEIENPDLAALLQGKLLRLRKDVRYGVCYQENARNFDCKMRPLFDPGQVVDQILVKLPPGLVRRCNEELRIMEKQMTRPEKRHGVYLSTEEPFGLLVTDMTNADDVGVTVAELKPKWLVQSPSAPVGAKRCRTCALREMKNDDARKVRGEEQRLFCPLDLISDNMEDVLRAVRFVSSGPDQVHIARTIYRNKTFHNLCALQRHHNDVGRKGPPAHSGGMSLGMTLRDCTVFFKIPSDERRPIDVRLGDLDLKIAAGCKGEYWLNIENRLIQEGWYAGTRPSQTNSECALQGRRRESSRPV